LKRFLAPLWVFIFGMGTDLLTYPQTSLQSFVQPPLRAACWLLAVRRRYLAQL
jgi:hypothetical protein